MRHRTDTVLIDRVLTSPDTPRRGRALLVSLVVTAVLSAGCGDNGGATTSNASTEAADTEPPAGLTSSDVCDLLTDSDVRSVLGADLASEPNDYPGTSPYPGCSWQTGRLIVQVAPGTSVVTAPGEDCSPLEIGDEALDCPGSVEFVVGGSRVIVSTIENLTPEQLAAIAEILEGKL